MKFTSPTINLWFKPEEFVKFIGNLEHYLAEPVIEVESNYSYPVGQVDDVTIYFMHYHSFAEAKKKWKERCERINLDDLYIMMTADSNIPDQVILNFERLPYKNKIVLTEKCYPNMTSSFQVIVNRKINPIYDLCRYKGRFTGKRYLDDFNYVEFLNH